MRRLLVAAAIVITMVSLSSSQKVELGVDFGYGFGMTDSVGVNNVSDVTYNMLSWEEVFGSRGTGWKIMGEGTFYLNENFGIMAISGYAWGGGYSTRRESYASILVSTIETSYVPVNIGLKLRGKIGPILPYMYMAPGLYFPQQKETRSASGNPDHILKYSFSTGFGFTAGAGAALTIFGKMGIKVEIAPTYAFADITEYTDSQTDQNNVTTTTTHIFKNNTGALPPSTQDTIYVYGQPRPTFNSVAMKLGVYYSF
jgi:hypothetical protein